MEECYHSKNQVLVCYCEEGFQYVGSISKSTIHGIHAFIIMVEIHEDHAIQ